MLKITSIKPMFNNILTTMNHYDKDEYENGSPFLNALLLYGMVYQHGAYNTYP